MFSYSAKHIAIAGAFLASVGGFILTLPDWSALQSPASIGALLVVVGTFFAGLHADKPSNGQS